MDTLINRSAAWADQLKLSVRRTPASRDVMTLATPSVDGARERARRLTWIALVAAIVSLMLIVLGTLFGVRSPWTSWALSLVLMCNAGVFLLPWARQHPRVTAMYYRFASIASLVIFVGIAVRFWHRFRS